MIDFTKEELYGLKNIILQSREDYPATHADELATKILNKVKFLIDNYCEHKYFNTDDRYYECNNCGKIWR